jgi:iron-sulfur cluster assembly protein
MKVSEAASKKIREMLLAQNLNPEDTYLRIQIVGGGCSGLLKKLVFVDKSQLTNHDLEFNENDCKVVVDSKSLLYVSEASIDYHDTLMGAGFVVDIPDARGCGCGESFSM